WRQEAAADNAMEIQAQASILHDRVSVFLGHMGSLHRGLSQAVGGYNAAAASLRSRVLPAGRRIQELGAATGELPEPARIEALPRTEYADAPVPEDAQEGRDAATG
ncbi:DNA recombination protein RmuC, partial [bacterium]|nr:DNA recombination protein RmuC [bacterium]